LSNALHRAVYHLGYNLANLMRRLGREGPERPSGCARYTTSLGSHGSSQLMVPCLYWHSGCVLRYYLHNDVSHAYRCHWEQLRLLRLASVSFRSILCACRNIVSLSHSLIYMSLYVAVTAVKVVKAFEKEYQEDALTFPQ
jgi:hypothetical protein